MFDVSYRVAKSPFNFRDYDRPEKIGVNANPSSAQNLWEVRQCFLWDNYIFELLPHCRQTHGVCGSTLSYEKEEYRRPIGYVNLSGATLHLVDGTTNSTSSPRSRKNLSGLNDGDGACVLSMRYFASSSPTAERCHVVLRKSTHRGTIRLMQQIESASKVFLKREWYPVFLILYVFYS